MATLTLTLVRGLPGCGKSTLAGPEACEADKFFVAKDGSYEFNPSCLPEAHAWCQKLTQQRLAEGNDTSVANTFSQRWEMEPYLKIAHAMEAELTVIDLFDSGLDDATLADRNTHEVPAEAIARMRERYENDWESGNSIPPWNR